MKKYSFKNDYSEGCHPKILETLLTTNMIQQPGYGDDEYSIKAKEFIKNKFASPHSEVYFVSGGTQANLLVISSLLKTYETVISASTGHINIHEAGAIEATGHRIESVETKDGKLTIEDINKILVKFENEHTAKPRMVYISNSTELGTIYTLKELEVLSEFCHNNNLLLFLDGARLGSALTATDNDIFFEHLAKLTDIFYIGATKNGGLIGEAIVVNNPNTLRDFKFYIKQRGALLAKGRLIGIQFLELFQDDLYLKLAKHANEMSEILTNSFVANGFEFLTLTTTNQIFPILPNSIIESLLKDYDFYIWKKVSEVSSAIRLVTSWATSKEMVEEFIRDLEILTIPCKK